MLKSTEFSISDFRLGITNQLLTELQMTQQNTLLCSLPMSYFSSEVHQT